MPYNEFISIHAPPRGATSDEEELIIRSRFQFTPLREGRHSTFLRYPAHVHISIHAPPRGATFGENDIAEIETFQFTPLREGRPGGVRQTADASNFNSRPSARGDSNRRAGHTARQISIHAPPRGATEEFERRDPAAFISIHAPPRGATARWITIKKTRRNFNSRPSARGDCFPHRLEVERIISIHAPPRGATVGVEPVYGEWIHFNSRPSARGD